MTTSNPSLGTIADWCGLIERAILDECIEVIRFVQMRIGTSNSLRNTSLSCMLSEIAPYRNDLVHGNAITKDLNHLVLLIFGVHSFHDWWKELHVCSATPFTTVLSGHVALQMSRQT